jgi:streptogramin lyase
MTIANQPTGGSASFLQFSQLTKLQVTIPQYSSVSRSVFVTSTNAEASVTVNVTQISGIGGTTVTNGLSGSTVLNPDITNPNITNPNITNPNITNPNITNYEVTNPNITNPNITNPNITNPNITNPNITNPNITNPNITNPNITNTSAVNITAPNPNITNPNITNPNITNPNITNPDITNGAIQDVNYGITNEGNTAASYTVKLATFSAPPGGILFQLILNKLYQTPTAQNCQLLQDTHWNTVANIVNPKLYQVSDPNLGNPNITNAAPTEASITLNPGETGYITARVVTPPGVTPINPLNYITPVTIAQAVNTQTVLANPGNPNLTSPPVYPQLTILNAALPATDRNDAGYSMQLTAMGGKPGALIWTIKAGSLPPGINLSSSGLISGTATTPGSYPVTIQVTDANSPADVAVQNYVLNVSLTPLTTQFVMQPPDGVVGQQYVATPLVVNGGTTPYTFTATGLPPGLSINSSTGQITGMPTVANPAGSPVMVTATDAATPAEQLTYSPTIHIGAMIQISPAAPAILAGGTLNVPYSNSQLSATGGIGGLVFGPPSLPNGGLLSATGLITFASPSVPSVSFTVSVHDQANPNQTVTSGTYTVNFSSGSIHFVAQPSNTVVNQVIAPAVSVQVLDSTAAPLPGVSVTLALTGPGTLGGSTTATTNATGIATFANLTVSAVGTGDTLQASALGAMVTSNAFNITAATAQACAPTPGPLLSWWPFNGNALDIRGGRPGTILGDTGGQSQFVSAQVGQGFKSGGEGILITSPTTPYLTPVNLTVGAWVRVDSLSNDATEQIVWQGDNGNTDFTTTPYSLGVLGNGSTAWVTYGGHSTFVGNHGPGKIVATFSDGINELDMFSNTALTPGVFYYVAITWDGPSGGASIWINGALDQTSGPAPLAGLLTPANPFQIGGIQGSGIGTESFNGVIDELQVWGNVLSQYQMQTIYNAGAAGQCQNIWFTESNGTTNRIGSIAQDGSNATEYTPPTANSFPYSIVAGPDGNVWFTENKPNNIGEFLSVGGGAGIGEVPIVSSTLPGTNSQYGALGLTPGPDGNLWFTESQCVTDPCFVGSISTGGTINVYQTPTSDSPPTGITAGPDGNLWFTEAGAGTHSSIARITPAGIATDYQTPTSGSAPGFITTGADGNLWFTESAVNQIGVINTSGTILHEYPIPPGVNAVSIGSGGTGYVLGDVITVVQPGASGGTFSVTNVNTAGTVLTNGLALQSIGTGYVVSPGVVSTTGGHGTGLTVAVASTTNAFGPAGITLGPDGNVWFAAANPQSNLIEVSPSGQFTAWPLPNQESGQFVTAGPDGNIWYTDNLLNAIGRLTLSTGAVTEFATPTTNSGPWGIGTGPAVQPIPAPPTSVQGSSPFDAPVITWTASTSSVVGYNVYRSPVDNSIGPFVLVNSGLITGTTFTDLGASTTQCGSHTFYYFVTAVGTGKTESQDSDQANAPVQGSC